MAVVIVVMKLDYTELRSGASTGQTRCRYINRGRTAVFEKVRKPCFDHNALQIRKKLRDGAEKGVEPRFSKKGAGASGNTVTLRYALQECAGAGGNTVTFECAGAGGNTVTFGCRW